ncbi:MAG: NPCBM/NEW2 domain-containing protein, partial [Candidatus Aminicenantales bacterium]
QALLPASWQNGRVPKVDYYYAPAPREPYGYAHFDAESGLVLLRNPWITHQVYSLKLTADCGLAPTAAGLSAVSLYPENRLYGTSLRLGDTLQVPLRPYETLALEIGPRQAPTGTPQAQAGAKSLIHSEISRLEASRVQFEGPAENRGDDWLNPMAGSAASMWLRFDGKIDIDAPQAELLVLCEEKSEEIDPAGSAWINGQKVRPILSGPHIGFNADGHRVPEHWQFLRYPLAHGRNRAVVELLTRSEEPRVSVWVWAFKPGEVRGSKHQNSLPQPYRISLDSARLMPETGIKASSLRTIRMRWPIEKIDGIYLDCRTPASTTGEIHKNTSAGKRSLLVAGERFQRGIGMVAPQQAVYDLKGQFQRFRSLVGVDAMDMYSRSDLVFEVWADGRKLWESGVLRRSDCSRLVDVDIAGAQTLTLTVRNVAPR